MASNQSAAAAYRDRKQLVGRELELRALSAIYKTDQVPVACVSGIAGVGKSTLLELFGQELQQSGGYLLRIACDSTEPTPAGFTAALGQALRQDGSPLEQLLGVLSAQPGVRVIALDGYESYLLMDSWLRNELLTQLPGNTRLLMLGRVAPSATWMISKELAGRLLSLRLEPLDMQEAQALLLRLEVPIPACERLIEATHGHPLALRLAASACRARPDIELDLNSLQQVLQALAEMFLDDVEEPDLRNALEGMSVIRRATVPLLRALLPESDPDSTYVRLSGLPFIDIRSDGLSLHEVVRDAIANCLRARDPERHTWLRQTAWQCLMGESRSVAGNALWRYTADMLYLIENPVVREAFFPGGDSWRVVEAADQEDAEAIARISRQHDGAEGAALLQGWRRRLPQCFRVIRQVEGRVAGFYCAFSPQLEDLGAASEDDPVISSWQSHLAGDPVATGETVLFCRRWLGETQGEALSEEQAAAWLDLKRTYMEMRPRLRRIYLVLANLEPYGAVAQRLGFRVLPECSVELAGVRYQTAMLDFAPGSVDGWLSNLAARELGIDEPGSLLDSASRELVLETGRAALTPLEFGVMQLLLDRQGEAVSRRDLLKEVWGTDYQGGSNVVDSVVAGLRRKLADRSDCVQTVSGVGYRYR